MAFYIDLLPKKVYTGIINLYILAIITKVYFFIQLKILVMSRGNVLISLFCVLPVQIKQSGKGSAWLDFAIKEKGG